MKRTGNVPAVLAESNLQDVAAIVTQMHRNAHLLAFWQSCDCDF